MARAKLLDKKTLENLSKITNGLYNSVLYLVNQDIKKKANFLPIIKKINKTLKY